ncbi:DHHA1 domain-containing protein [Planococcus sp. ISL-109]|uniref:alanyl-tRNA editing protein n=1 Tax=Planococcus sp. ISL-109 TaxID=2819166 RepID=UPI001BE77C63|nr:DHHA1 domain-containing protein [Planococcus sp. ISL-109]MBT2583490.1 alanyl-tRNA editing protein [Planococcus sp. ISL-109]
MTEKLYYEDSFLQQAQVSVTASGTDERGDYVLLDQTCFYPEGGGQPADHGTIGDVSVIDVQSHDGDIRHYINRPLGAGRFLATLDWQRRWDHMQQHAGQHLLSALLEDGHGYQTTSFHLGAERVSIDLHRASIDPFVLQQVELEANRLISRHLPMRTCTVSETQLHELELRKPPAVSGAIRLVEIEGIDLNACGGTHPDNTAGIGLLKIVGTEKAKGGTRLYFLCGERALDYFARLNETADALVAKLHAPLSELAQAADNLLAEKLWADKEIMELKKQLIQAEAKSLAPERGLIIQQFGGRPVKELQQLARLTVEQHPSISVLFAAQEDGSMRFVCARGNEATSDMRETLKRLLEETDGKGGGTPALAQGGGQTNVPFDRFREIFQQLHATN